jgi:hypothetical protein
MDLETRRTGAAERLINGASAAESDLGFRGLPAIHPTSGDQRMLNGHDFLRAGKYILVPGAELKGMRMAWACDPL